MELVLFIGLPGAGKSTFYQQRFATTHALVSKDLLRTNRQPARRQLQLIEEALQEGHSLAVDNTNASRAERADVIALGKRLRAHIVGYYLASDVASCRERNARRKVRQRVPDIAIFATLKRLERPDYNEGFEELYYVRNNEEAGFTISDWTSAEP